MSLRGYIKGERYGKDARQLEREAMDDPFLQDAIEGYDQSNNHSASYDLKKLKRQINKRTRDNFYYTQLLSIAACVLIIICLSVFFFVYDSDRTGMYENENTAYIENRVDNKSSAIHMDQVDAKKENQIDTEKENIEAINQQEDLFAEKEPVMVQQRLERKSDENSRNYWDYQPIDEVRDYADIRDYADVGDYTVSENEVQAILSEYHRDRKETNNLNQSSNPVGGKKAYDDYIKNNLENLSDNACAEQHGKVILLFKVNEKGRPVDISILRSVCRAVDREAIQLLQNGPDWTAGDNFTQLEIVF